MKKTEIILILSLVLACASIDIYFKTNLSILGFLAMSFFNLIESRRSELLKDDIRKLNGQLADKDRQIDEINQNYLFVRNQVGSLNLEIDEKYQELSLLRQKYSRTNQPRSGGKFVKKTKQVSVLSLKQICENNLGVARPSEMSNGEISKVCGYSLDYDCLIFGLDSYAGFTTFPDTSVIFNEYKSYEYGRL